MTFNSWEFLVFYPITLLLYFLLPKKWSRISLLFMSAIFYLAWNYKLIVLIMFTTAVSYFCARIIEKTEKKAVKKLCIVVTLIACLGVLFFFKYYNFIAETLGWAIAAAGGGTYDFTLNLVLPVGISFYTFQTLSYAIDVYRGTEKVERDFALYCLFVTFFPQLVAGPIERPENLLPQLRADHKFNRDDTAAGLRLMLTGFFKKIAVADLCAAYVVPVFSEPERANGMSVILAAVLFAFQIYGDFAGYTDIAIGCARVMGIKLMKNFDRPYTAESIKEFWARWHISLSSWFRDYLYIPLGGNRCSKARHLCNLMTVFLVSGLWHGAAWTYVIWGALHGFYQVVGILTKKLRAGIYDRLRIDRDSRAARLWRRGVTFVLVTFAWIFFRANSISDIGTLLARLFGAWTLGGNISTACGIMGLTLPGAAACISAITAMCLLDKYGESDIPVHSKTRAHRLLAAVKYASLIWAIAFAWLILLDGDGASSFIYFQF